MTHVPVVDLLLCMALGAAVGWWFGRREFNSRFDRDLLQPGGPETAGKQAPHARLSACLHNALRGAVIGGLIWGTAIVVFD